MQFLRLSCRFTAQRLGNVQVHRLIHKRRNLLVRLSHGKWSEEKTRLSNWWSAFRKLLHSFLLLQWINSVFEFAYFSTTADFSFAQVEKTSTAKSLHRTPDPSTFPSAPGAPEIINVTENSVTISWPTSHDGTSSGGSPSGSLIG